MNRRSGLRIFSDAERTVTIVVTFNALDIRLFVHILQRENHLSRIFEACSSSNELALRIVFAVLHLDIELKLRVGFEVQLGGIRHNHLVTIHAERHVRGRNFVCQLSEFNLMNRVRIGSLHFGNDGAIRKVFSDFLFDLFDRRLFIHVDNLDNADKRISQAVPIYHSENHRVNGVDSFIVKLCAVLHHDGHFSLSRIQRNIEQLGGILTVLVGKSHLKLALVSGIHIFNCKGVNRRSGLRIFSDAERTIAVVVAFDALDVRLFVHILQRENHLSRIFKTGGASNELALRIVFAVLHLDIELKLRVGFEVQLGGIRNNHLVTIHIERHVRGRNFVCQLGEFSLMDRIRIGCLHFGNDGAVRKVFSDFLFDLFDCRLFVHVNDIDDADKRIGQAVQIYHCENHCINGVDSFIVELCAILHHDGHFGLGRIQRHIEQLGGILTVLVGKGHRKLTLVSGIHIGNRKGVNRRSGLRIFSDAERTVAVVVAFDALDVRLFIHVVNRHGNGSRIGQLRIILVRDSHLEGIGRRHLMVEFPIHLHDIGIHAERNILIHNGIDQFTICRSLGIGILGRNLTHFIINLGIFGDAECSIIDTRSLVHIDDLDFTNKRIGKVSLIGHNQAHNIRRIEIFVIELGTIQHEDFHLSQIIIELDAKERVSATTVRVYDGERKYVTGIHITYGKLVNRRTRRRIFFDFVRSQAVVVIIKTLEIRIFVFVLNRNRHRRGIGQCIFMSIRNGNPKGISCLIFMVQSTVHKNLVRIQLEGHIFIHDRIDQFTEVFGIVIRIRHLQSTD